MSPNLVERFFEWLVGYSVDWDATGTWAQLLAALIALYAAFRISRRELDAQRQVAADARREFAVMVLGVCDVAAGFIYEASRQFSDKDDVEAMLVGDVPEPTAASIVIALQGLDVNRMPNAGVAVGLSELRRLCGWTKTNRKRAQEWLASDGDLPVEFVEAMAAWRTSAQDQLNNVRKGFAAAAEVDRQLLKGGLPVRLFRQR